jgi:hypothetical protein
MRAVLFASLVVASACIGGCPGNESGPRNGVDKVLYFSDVDFKSDLGGIPLGVTRKVTVQRYIGGTKVCEPSLSHGGGDCSGGAEKDVITIESARCESFECKVELSREGDTQVIRFSSSNAGKTRLRVNAKSSDDGEIYSDAIEMRFAEAKRIALRADEGRFLPLAMPMFKGLEFGFPLAEVVDADGEWLKLDAGYVEIQITGTSLVREGASHKLKAVGVGVTTLKWDVPGVIARSIDVEVIEPAPVQSLVVMAARPSSALLLNDRKGVGDLDDFLPRLETAPVTVIEHEARKFSTLGDQPIAFARLADGRRAVAPLSDAQIVPALGEATAKINESAPWIVTLTAPGTPGETTLHLEAGAAKTSIPVRFTSP